MPRLVLTMLKCHWTLKQSRGNLNNRASAAMQNETILQESLKPKNLK